MFGTYKKEDVTILLKDITGLVEPLETKARERLIQSGGHYCEMLPLEYKPNEGYLEAYEYALNNHAEKTARAVVSAAEKVLRSKGKDVVLVSLARAGTPAGILIKHYLDKKYRLNVPHYTVSIIRGRGIDNNAMKYILERHAPQQVQFVDGWTGKGAIKGQLIEAMRDYPGVDSEISVLADPARITRLAGVQEDFPIASSFLNATVSGLLSRTFLRKDIIGEGDFHGAAFYSVLLPEDRTYEFIEKVESCFGAVPQEAENAEADISCGGVRETAAIAGHFGVSDINLVKPGIGETTRVLLRRYPWKVLVHSLHDELNLGHIYRLAREKNVEVCLYPLKMYRACGIIRKLSDA